MTLKALTSKFQNKLPLVVIVLFSLGFHLYRISDGFNFEYDQQVPAQAAYDFFKGGKLSLIGQELSFQGLFTGPLHNWIQFIPYGACHLFPDCTVYFFLVTDLINLMLLYLLVEKIFSRKLATITSTIYGLSFVVIGLSRGVTGNYFLFTASIGIFYCLYNYFKGRDKFLILGSAIAGLATVNSNPIFLFPYVAFLITALLRKKRNLKTFIFSLFAFAINFLPLFIFNLRHQDLLQHAYQNFANKGFQPVNYFSKAAFLIFRIQIPYYNNFLFQTDQTIFKIITTLIIIFGFYLILSEKTSTSKSGMKGILSEDQRTTAFRPWFSIFKRKVKSSGENKFLLIIPIWILTVLIGFLFYNQHIPDYYFIQTLLPLIILVALVVSKNRVLALIFLSVFIFMNIKGAQNYKFSINYERKKATVSYIVGDTKSDSFNLYYDMPPGANTGYAYLLKVYGKEPIEGGKNLYIIVQNDAQVFDMARFIKPYPGKNIQVKDFGFNHVVSVK